MTKITNILGLPEPLVRAVENDPYDSGPAHISVTSLIGPARKRRLEIDNADQISEDASQRVWALMGQVAHGILERADVGGITERRLFIERHGWTISGQFDRLCLFNHALQDWKVTSTYAIKGGYRDEWIAQLNIYGLMARLHGYHVDRLEIVAILRDWSKAKARHAQDSYPQQPVVKIAIPIWPDAKIASFIKSRLIAHGRAQTELPDCTPEERWERPATFRIMKTGNVKATSRHDTLENAKSYLQHLNEKAATKVAGKTVGTTKRPKKPDTYRIEREAAEQVRCKDYCPAAPFCDQWKRLRPGGAIAATLGQRRVMRGPVETTAREQVRG